MRQSSPRTWTILPLFPPALSSTISASPGGLPVTLALAKAGVKVKATGFGRVTLDVAEALAAIADAAPHALMAGTDLPSTRAARPFEDGDLALIRRVLGPDLAEAALHRTAASFYRI